MTRKRFIKLLMSHGESKRKAQAIAHMYNLQNKPYGDAYKNYCYKKLFNVSATCQKLTKALVECGASIRSMAKSLAIFHTSILFGGR